MDSGLIIEIFALTSSKAASVTNPESSAMLKRQRKRDAFKIKRHKRGASARVVKILNLVEV